MCHSGSVTRTYSRRGYTGLTIKNKIKNTKQNEKQNKTLFDCNYTVRQTFTIQDLSYVHIHAEDVTTSLNIIIRNVKCTHKRTHIFTHAHTHTHTAHQSAKIIYELVRWSGEGIENLVGVVDFKQMSLQSSFKRTS